MRFPLPRHPLLPPVLALLVSAGSFVFLNPSATLLYCRRNLEFYRGREVRIPLHPPEILRWLPDRPLRLGLVLKEPLTPPVFESTFAPFGRALHGVVFFFGTTPFARVQGKRAQTASEMAAALRKRERKWAARLSRPESEKFPVLGILGRYGLPGRDRSEVRALLAKDPRLRGLVRTLFFYELRNALISGILAEAIPHLYGVELKARPREVYRRLGPRLEGVALMTCLIGVRPFLPERLPAKVQGILGAPEAAFSRIEDDPEALLEALESLVRALYGVELFPESDPAP